MNVPKLFSSKPEEAQLRAHEQPVTSACVAIPSGRVVTASFDATLAVFEAADGRMLMRLPKQKAPVRFVVSLEGDDEVAFGVGASVMRLSCGGGGGNERAPLPAELYSRRGRLAQACAYDATQCVLFVGFSDGMVTALKVDGGGATLLGGVKDHGAGAIRALRLCSAGTVLFAAAGDRLMRWAQLREPVANKGQFGDGVVLHRNYAGQLFDIEVVEGNAVFFGERHYVYAIEVGGGGAVGGDDDAAMATALPRAHHTDVIIFASDINFLFAGSVDGEVVAFNLETRTPAFRMRSPVGPTTALCVRGSELLQATCDPLLGSAVVLKWDVVQAVVDADAADQELKKHRENSKIKDENYGVLPGQRAKLYDSYARIPDLYKSLPVAKQTATVTADFVDTAHASTLSVRAGDVVDVLVADQGTGWTYAMLDGRRGHVPTSYIRANVAAVLPAAAHSSSSSSRPTLASWSTGSTTSTTSPKLCEACLAAPTTTQGDNGAWMCAQCAAGMRLNDRAPLSSASAGDTPERKLQYAQQQLIEPIVGMHMHVERWLPKGDSKSDWLRVGKPKRRWIELHDAYLYVFEDRERRECYERTSLFHVDAWCVGDKFSLVSANQRARLNLTPIVDEKTAVNEFSRDALRLAGGSDNVSTWTVREYARFFTSMIEQMSVELDRLVIKTLVRKAMRLYKKSPLLPKNAGKAELRTAMHIIVECCVGDGLVDALAPDGALRRLSDSVLLASHLSAADVERRASTIVEVQLMCVNFVLKMTAASDAPPPILSLTKHVLLFGGGTHALYVPARDELGLNNGTERSELFVAVRAPRRRPPVTSRVVAPSDGATLVARSPAPPTRVCVEYACDATVKHCDLLELTFGNDAFCSLFVPVRFETVRSTRLVLSELVISRDDPLGSGSFGVVQRAHYRGELVAVKSFVRPEDFNAEHAILESLSAHNNLVRYVGACVDRAPYQGFIVLEYVTFRSPLDGRLFSASLDSLIFADQDGLSPELTRRVLREVVEGLAFLHEKKVLHLDLKPANVLLASLLPEDAVVAKICDFGLAAVTKALSETFISAVPEGTWPYMAPEMIELRQTSEKSDIFSLGVTMCELFTRTHAYSTGAFADKSLPQLKKDDLKIRGASPVDIPSNHPYTSLMRRCVSVNAAERPTANEVRGELYLIALAPTVALSRRSLAIQRERSPYGVLAIREHAGSSDGSSISSVGTYASIYAMFSGIAPPTFNVLARGGGGGSSDGSTTKKSSKRRSKRQSTRAAGGGSSGNKILYDLLPRTGLRAPQAADYVGQPFYFEYSREQAEAYLKDKPLRSWLVRPSRIAGKLVLSHVELSSSKETTTTVAVQGKDALVKRRIGHGLIHIHSGPDRYGYSVEESTRTFERIENMLRSMENDLDFTLYGGAEQFPAASPL